MSSPTKNQFSIRALFFLMVVVSFSIVICQSLAGLSEEVFVVSLLVSAVSALVGFAMVGLSILFAFGIAITEEFAPLKKRNLRQCFHMFVMGVVAVGPSLLLIAVAIFA